MVKICIRVLKRKEILLVLLLLFLVGFVNYSIREKVYKSEPGKIRDSLRGIKENNESPPISNNPNKILKKSIVSNNNNNNVASKPENIKPDNSSYIDSSNLLNNSVDASVFQTSTAISTQITTTEPSLLEQIFYAKKYSKICGHPKSTTKFQIDSIFPNAFDVNIFSNTEFYTVFLIVSDIMNTEAREKLRLSWCSLKQFQNLKIQCLFFITTKTSLNSKQKNDIQAEFNEYLDVIFINELYSNRNINKIYIKILEIAVLQRPNSKYFTFVNDGMLVNIPTLIEAISTYSNIKQVTDHSGLLLCRAKRGFKPVRSKKNAWYVSKAEYRRVKYPDFCDLEVGMVWSRDVARDILMCYQYSPKFWIADIFITGILPQKLNLSIESFIDDFTSSNMLNHYIYKDLKRNTFLTNGYPYDIRTWKLIFSKSLTNS